MAEKAPEGAPAAAPKGKEWPELVVTGCADQTISHIVKGVYHVSTTNHNKPVYKKYEKAKGLDVLIYFWDDRDGLELCGWWFGPAVGGDQVWAFHPSRTSITPPANEWNIPNDGPIDSTFSITPRAARPKAAEEDDIRKQLETMRKEQVEMMKRMEEIQKRSEERRKREEELRRRAGGGEAGSGSGGTKRPRGADGDEEEEQRKRKDAAVNTARAEEERRRLEHEARKKKEEERRKAEEVAKQRKDDERRLLDEQMKAERERRLREEEEQRRVRAERRKREEEEARRKRDAETAQRKAEDDRRRQQEAERQKDRQRRLNEDARKRREHLCQLGMLEALTRLAHSVPEDYDAYVRMLNRALESLLPHTGKQRETLKAEADRVLTRTASFIKVAETQAAGWETWHALRQSLPPSMLPPLLTHTS